MVDIYRRPSIILLLSRMMAESAAIGIASRRTIMPSPQARPVVAENDMLAECAAIIIPRHCGWEPCALLLLD